MSAPNWFNVEALSAEIDRLKGFAKTDEEVKAVTEKLVERIKALDSIKKVDIDLKSGKFDIQEKSGLLPTYVGGDVGNESSVKIESGWSNYFKIGDIAKASGKMTQQKSPSIDISFSVPIKEGTDYSLPNPFQIGSLSLKVERSNTYDYPVDSASVSASLSAGKNVPFSTSLSLSAIKQDVDEKPPLVYKFDPSPYFKLALSFETPSIPFLQSSLQLAAVSDQKMNVTPFAKMRWFSNIHLPFGISAFASAGYIAAPAPIPHSERFTVGGLPLTRGVETNRLGYSIGNFPCGSDVFAAAGVSESLLLFPEYQVNGHVFLNAATARSLRSNDPLGRDPVFSSVVSAGAGLTFTQGPIRVEANVQIPLFTSGGVKFLQYQFGFGPA